MQETEVSNRLIQIIEHAQMLIPLLLQIIRPFLKLKIGIKAILQMAIIFEKIDKYIFEKIDKYL